MSNTSLNLILSRKLLEIFVELFGTLEKPLVLIGSILLVKKNMNPNKKL